MNNSQIEYNHRFSETLRWQIQSLMKDFVKTGDRLYYVAASLKRRELLELQRGV